MVINETPWHGDVGRVALGPPQPRSGDTSCLGTAPDAPSATAGGPADLRRGQGAPPYNAPAFRLRRVSR